MSFLPTASGPPLLTNDQTVQTSNGDECDCTTMRGAFVSCNGVLGAVFGVRLWMNGFQHGQTAKSLSQLCSKFWHADTTWH